MPTFGEYVKRVAKEDPGRARAYVSSIHGLVNNMETRVLVLAYNTVGRGPARQVYLGMDVPCHGSTDVDSEREQFVARPVSSNGKPFNPFDVKVFETIDEAKGTGSWVADPDIRAGLISVAETRRPYV